MSVRIRSPTSLSRAKRRGVWPRGCGAADRSDRAVHRISRRAKPSLPRCRARGQDAPAVAALSPRSTRPNRQADRAAASLRPRCAASGARRNSSSSRPICAYDAPGHGRSGPARRSASA
ncbi:MAG: hypothetical protein MZV49_02250 [Rhodopseudomonas palustris]|nr:hypothetical protein [Rhodopseudomonas palustris]